MPTAEFLVMPPPLEPAASGDDARPTSVCLSRTSGLSREQRPGRQNSEFSLQYAEAQTASAVFKYRKLTATRPVSALR